MNGRTRKKLYKIVAERDGEFCKRCSVPPIKRKLILDHIDNDNDHNLPENIQILCRRCNYLKNPRRRPVDLCVNASEPLEENSEINISKKREPLFRKFVLTVLNERNQVLEKDLIYSGAEHIGISPVTAKRYLDKMCSSMGICEKIQSDQTIVVRYKSTISLT